MRVSDAGLTDKEGIAAPGDALGELGLEGLVFHAFHGCFERERLEGGAYVVDLTVRFDMSRAIGSDALEDTVDVQRLYDIVAAQMAIPRNLIETVAGAILAQVRALPEILEAEVTVRKCNPPLSGGKEEQTPACESSFVRLKG